jgi:DNA-binding NarL/FixJ family response regulator
VAKINTLVVARDQLFREGLTQIIGKHFAIVGVTGLDQALEEIAGGLRPRLLIVEAAAVRFGVLQRIRSHMPTVKIVVLTDPDHPAPLVVPAHCDIDGCMPLNMSPETLELSLGLIIAGQAVMPSSLATAMHRRRTGGMRRDARRFLTPRECDVLRLLGLGHMTKEIARELGVSTATVKSDLKMLLGKLEVRNRTEAAVWAVGQIAGTIGTTRRHSEGRRPN